MVEQVCGRAEELWTMMGFVHVVWVTCEAREGKAEKFTPKLGRRVRGAIELP